MTLTPLGFSVKVIHNSVRPTIVYLSSTTISQKIYKIWNNPNLMGHCLTSAPSKYYRFSAAPLCWHLRGDGTDRRTYIAAFPFQSKANIQEAEYELIPFEFFEFIYRRAVFGTITLVACTASPIGLLIKIAHSSVKKRN